MLKILSFFNFERFYKIETIKRGSVRRAARIHQMHNDMAIPACGNKKERPIIYLKFCDLVLAEPELFQVDQAIQVLDYLFKKKIKKNK